MTQGTRKRHIEDTQEHPRDTPRDTQGTHKGHARDKKRDTQGADKGYERHADDKQGTHKGHVGET